MEQGSMFSAAFDALKEVLEISPVDKVLILNDIHSKTVSDAFSEAAQFAGCETVSYLINEKERPLKEIPAALADLLPGKTIVLNILKAFPEEINFRIKWLFKIEQDKKAKCAHMPGITEAMMSEGPMKVNYKDMRKSASLLMEALKDADHLHISAQAGTDLELGIRDRIFTDDVFVKPGGMCNLPCGEIYCAPEETRADGVIIFDASIGDIGLLKTPLNVFVERGKISLFESADKKLVERITELSSIDEDAKIIGELGIGINPSARITGNMLEDEKAIRTAHIAFGNNEDFPGVGKNRSKIHRDFLFHKPDIEIFYKDNSYRLLIKKGEFLI
jgi:leucyl aminopeptidase (aminopeptidase T)